jgi:hypothetical protein
MVSIYGELFTFYEMLGLFQKSSTFCKLKSLPTGSPPRVGPQLRNSSPIRPALLVRPISFSPYRVWLSLTACSVQGPLFLRESKTVTSAHSRLTVDWHDETLMPCHFCFVSLAYSAFNQRQDCPRWTEDERGGAALPSHVLARLRMKLSS